jgi:hypothetical protein
VTGYFARMAARTGVGGQGSSPATHDAPAPQQFVTEDVVTFVTQPQRIARAPDMPSHSGEQRITPALPPAALAPRAVAARFAVPDARAFEQTPTETHIRSAETPVRTANTPGRLAESPRPRRDVTSTTLQPADHTGPAATVETEPRIVHSAIAVPAAQGVNAPTSAASPLLPTPLFELVTPVALEEIEAKANPEHAARADLIAPVRPQASAPEFRVAPLGREEAVSARQALPPRPANGQVRPRLQEAPSVRIGSIQVDVHAPLPPPLPTPPRRASPLRRFYLRDW